MSTSGALELDVASTGLSDVLLRLVRTMERTGAQVAARRRGEVDKAAYSLLFRLLHDGPQRSGALAEATLTDPSTVSRHVAHLVGAGLVERAADPADGRATVLAVTERGREVADELHERRNATVATVVSDWEPAAVSHLTELLARFADDLEHHRPRILAACCDTDEPASTTLTTQGES